MPLTQVAIKNAKADDKAVKLFDSGGLFLLVQPAGGKWWRLAMRSVTQSMICAAR
ncbi:MAG: Arm DNA-binding domain-containing protein [Holosporaceae bacterium]